MLNKSDSNISFSSGIKFVQTGEFSRLAGNIREKYFVNYPWSAKQTVKGFSAYTRDVKDCTMGGITDGRDVVMFHVSPNQRNISTFKDVEASILDKISLTNPELQGFLLGSTSNNPMSQQLLKMFEDFMKKCKIKYSVLAGQDTMANTNVLYDSRKDDWVIASNLIDELLPKKLPPEEIAKKLFKDVSIAEFDEFV